MRGSSTAPSISRSRPGSPIWRRAIAANPNDHLVIFGYSQSALIANREKRKLAEQYPTGTTAPDIDFVLGGDPNLPNGGFFARFPGLYIPILDWTLNGPAPTDTQFDTVEIIHEYDFMADFPLYPLNGIAVVERGPGLRLRALVPVRRQPGSRSDDTAAYPQQAPATPTITSSRPRTCRCSVRCAPLGCPSS